MRLPLVHNIRDFLDILIAVQIYFVQPLIKWLQATFEPTSPSLMDLDLASQQYDIANLLQDTGVGVEDFIHTVSENFFPSGAYCHFSLEQLLGLESCFKQALLIIEKWRLYNNDNDEPPPYSLWSVPAHRRAMAIYGGVTTTFKVAYPFHIFRDSNSYWRLCIRNMRDDDGKITTPPITSQGMNQGRFSAFGDFFVVSHTVPTDGYSSKKLTKALKLNYDLLCIFRDNKLKNVVFDVTTTNPYHALTKRLGQDQKLEECYKAYRILPAAISDLYYFSRDYQSITLAQALDFIWDMCFAVYEIHNLGVVHNDIKLRNFLIYADHTVMLTDFEGARKVGERMGTHTYHYLSPEKWYYEYERKYKYLRWLRENNSLNSDQDLSLKQFEKGFAKFNDPRIVNYFQETEVKRLYVNIESTYANDICSLGYACYKLLSRVQQSFVTNYDECLRVLAISAWEESLLELEQPVFQECPWLIGFLAQMVHYRPDSRRRPNLLHLAEGILRYTLKERLQGTTVPGMYTSKRCADWTVSIDDIENELMALIVAIRPLDASGDDESLTSALGCIDKYRQRVAAVAAISFPGQDDTQNV